MSAYVRTAFLGYSRSVGRFRSILENALTYHLQTWSTHNPGW